MTHKPLPQSPAYQEVLHGLLLMHKYTVDGQDASENADALRESMGDAWERLSAVERERITGLSKDLYEVSAPPRAPEQMNPQAQGKLSEATDAREQGEWDRALELLRRWGKFVPPSLLSYLRARTWKEAGDREVAVVFFEHACKLDPQNENFQAMYLNVLKWTDLARARTVAEPILNESEKHIPNLVIQAAEVLHGVATSLSEHEAAPIYRRLIGILTPLLSRTKDEEGLEHPTQESMILLLLATFHRWLGETREAYDYYSRAILLEPWNDALLIARGIIVYGTNPSAIADFEQAIRLNSGIVWPYYYLAHYLLSNNRMEDCRRMCEVALGKPAPPRIQSELCEFLGIALTNLGYPPQVVQRAFENAIRVDPSNERARENLRRFLAAIAVKPPRPIDWERPSDSYIRSSGQQQLRTTPAIYEQNILVRV